MTGQASGHIGERIKAARTELGMSQTSLAAALNVRERTVSRWEDGKTEPAFAQLLPLSRALGRSLHWLVTGTELNGDPIAA